MKILLVTAHPDDEAIWGAASLSSLALENLIEVNVICLWTAVEPPGSMSGTLDKKADYLREFHFYNSIKVLGFSSSFICTSDYPNKTSEETLNHGFIDGLKAIGKNLEYFDVIITHSYYGDERRHPHHVLIFNFLQKLLLEKNIGHSFYSFIPIKSLKYNPKLSGIRRAGNFHLIGEFDCLSTSELKEGLKIFAKEKQIKMFICQGDLASKRKAIHEYTTIDLKKHDKDYGSFTTSTDFLYCDEISFEKFRILFQGLEVPTLIADEM